MTYANALKVLDYRASTPRTATQADLISFVRLGDAMPEVKVVGPVCWPQDAPGELQALHAASIVMSSTAKHNRCSQHDLQEVRTWVEVAQIASRTVDLSQRPTIHFGLSPTSPLRLDARVADVLLYLTRQGLPLCVGSCPMAGATSPFTLAGTLVLANSEHLFLLTVAQLIREGTPMIIGGAAGIIDMRTGNLSYGCPERSLMLGASVDLVDHYGLPHAWPSGSVDAWHPDVQSGAEKALTWGARLLKETALGVTFGSLLTGSTVSLEQMLIDADLLKTAERLFRGVRVTDETLALESVQRVGPGGGFLADRHTLRWLRSGEHYYSDLVNREGPEGQDMVAQAHKKVQRTLQDHQTTVPNSILHEIERYVAKSSRRPVQ